MPNFTIHEISDRIKANNRTSDILNVTINGSTRYKLNMYHRHVYDYRKLRKLCAFKVVTLKARPPSLKLFRIICCNRQKNNKELIHTICTYTKCPYIAPVHLT